LPGGGGGERGSRWHRIRDAAWRRRLSWPPEADFVLVSLLGVAGSFGLGALLVRLPGVRRVL
jgi:hypothetical protein